MSVPYTVHGLNKAATRYIREEVQADNACHAMRIVRAMHPDAGSLACRAPKHAEAVLEALANRATADRVVA